MCIYACLSVCMRVSVRLHICTRNKTDETVENVTKL